MLVKAIASYRENKKAIAKRYCVVSDQILELISSFFEKFNYNIVQWHKNSFFL
jgi:hypothetical protein